VYFSPIDQAVQALMSLHGFGENFQNMYMKMPPTYEQQDTSPGSLLWW